MTRLRALNESSSDDSEEDSDERETVEAQEERAFSQYKRALELRQAGCFADAELLLISLLNDDFLADVSSEDQSEGADALTRPAVALKYACLKNLGNVLVLQDRFEDGLKCYLQAVELDETDVSLWLQMGRIALQIDDFHLASQALQEGLRCNPHHWPCLDALLPILYALNDYLGCLLLVSRTLVLDSGYSQAVALRDQIFKEDPSLIQNFKFFFPDENDISEVASILQEEERSSFVSHALSLQERYQMKNPSQSSCIVEADTQKLKICLPSHTWVDLGQSLLKAYSTIILASDLSYLNIVEISTTEPVKSSELRSQSLHTAEPEKLAQVAMSSTSAVDAENDGMDVESELDAKGEDQTEEDVTEASGLEQEDESKALSSTPQNHPVLKKKKKRSSTSLMDQWSKRRSGRRSGRKVEDRDESNLASCFRSLLPDSLLPTNLEAELAKASRRRSLRDPIDLLALGDDSMDTEELCRLLQERDAKDKQIKGPSSKENITQRISNVSYFGTDLEASDVGTFVREKGKSTSNIIEILSEFILEVSKKHDLTWPSSLVPVYVGGYECMRKHISFPSPFDEFASTKISAASLNASLLYCELIIDMWQQKRINDQDMLGDAGLVLSGALGHIMLLSGLGHIFSARTDQFKTMLRIHWLKAHLFLLQENSPSAICSLQDVIDSLNIIDGEGTRQYMDRLSLSHLESNASGLSVVGQSSINETIRTTDYFEGIRNESGNEGVSESCEKTVLETTQQQSSSLAPVVENLLTLDNAQNSENVCANMKADTSPHETNNAEQVTSLQSNMRNEGVTELVIRTDDESSRLDVPSCILSDEVLTEKDGDVTMVGDLVALKHQITLSVGGGKVSSGFGDLVVKLAATEETTMNADQGFAYGEEDPGNCKALDENEGTVQPRDKQESDANNCQVGEEKNEQEEIDQPKAVVSTSTVEEVLNEEVLKLPILELPPSNLSAAQVNEQCEPLVSVVPSIPIEEFVKPVEKVEKSLDSNSTIAAGMSSDLQPEIIADESPNPRTITSADPQTENLTSEFADPIQKPTVDESSDHGATIIADDCSDSKAKKFAHDLNICYAASKLSEKTTRTNPNETVDVGKTKEQAKGVSNSFTSQEESSSYILSNCRLNQEISKRMAQKLLTSLMRRQQLGEIDDLYSTSQYDTLASTLTECFKYCALQADCENPEIDDLPDRATQMAMLLDSLWQLQRYGDCFYWAEACLHESFNRYLNATDSENTLADQDDHQMWATTVERILAGLNSCLKVAGLDILQNLPKPSLTRLVQTLTSILCQQLEHSDCSVEMAIECITPWLLLHRVIYFEELQFPQYWDSIPSHVAVLFTAHEHMAKKARCCLNEGVLLNLIMDIVVPKIRSLDVDPNLLPSLTHEVDQAILCLYGHPKKPAERSKKRLQDHKVHQHLELTWERSLSLIRFYEPDELPTFDSNGWRLSIEEEQLFLRVLQLVPSDSNPNRYLGDMKAFLRGKVDTLPEVQCSIPEAAWNLYYLLADFYLKTYKWEPASKFYKLDVCLNPKRFDSWAGMALSFGTLMYQDINSCDTFDNDAQLRRKNVAQQCFQIAVELDPENTTMWIEYGNFAYTTHSLCSRLLKTETESLSMEMFTKLEEEKDKMLNITEKCFKAAEKLDQDEGWLQQYMLGKVAEKRGEDPKIFLQHYRLAAQLLFESNAEYPLTINYNDNTKDRQHYAFEAHEVHYRIHASILKHLELMEGKYLSDELEELYKEVLDEAANSPFMAVRVATLASVTAKRSYVDPLTKSHKKLKLDEVTGLKPISVEDNEISISDVKTSPTNIDTQSDKDCGLAESSSDGTSTLAIKAEHQSVTRLEGMTVLYKKGEGGSMLLSDFDWNKTATNSAELRRQSSQGSGEDVSPKIGQVLSDGQGATDLCKEMQVLTVPNDSLDSLSSPGSSVGNEDPSVEPKNARTDTMEMDAPQDLSKQSNKAVVSHSNNDTPLSSQPPNGAIGKSLDHTDLIKQCLIGIEECLVRYRRHYKSFYRLSHHFYLSKQHRNFKKCRMLLLGDYRVVRLNKNISGLFKSANVNSMFNDVWRMPIDEIDRAGSFASHMSRCVHLLMDLLRAQKDHKHLLKLSIFLKRDPEKKEKKYLRDNERCDLSKQALMMCLTAMRECANEARSLDNVTELYQTVKDGIKEMPIKEGTFKSLLCDAYNTYKKSRNFQPNEDSSYEEASEFCQKELQRAASEAKAKVQAAQVQMQAQALQVQAQAQAHMQAQAQVQALQPQPNQMGVNAMGSTLPFNSLAPRFPGGINPPMQGNTLANPMFLPQLPVHRGRGRPPKAQQQLRNAMMNMAHMINLANSNALVTGGIDSSKPKQMKKQQKQRQVMQQPTSSMNPVVSSIIKDRPALSITTLPNAVSMSSMTTSSPSSSVGGSNVMQGQAMSLPRPQSRDPPGWNVKPRPNCPRPINALMPKTANSEGSFTSNNTPGLHGAPRQKLVLPKLGSRKSKALPGTSSVPRTFHTQSPRPFVPHVQASVPLNDPAAILSRLPGLQVKQRSQQQPVMTTQQQGHGVSLKSKDSSISKHQQQPLDRSQKPQLTNVQAPKPVVSISKGSAPSSSGIQGENSSRSSESKKGVDASFDVITLD